MSQYDVFDALIRKEPHAIDYFRGVTTAVQEKVQASDYLGYALHHTKPFTLDDYRRFAVPPPVQFTTEEAPKTLVDLTTEPSAQGQEEQGRNEVEVEEIPQLPQPISQKTPEPAKTSDELATNSGTMATPQSTKKKPTTSKKSGIPTEVSDQEKAKLLKQMKKRNDAQVHPNTDQARILLKARQSTTPAQQKIIKKVKQKTSTPQSVKANPNIVTKAQAAALPPIPKHGSGQSSQTSNGTPAPTKGKIPATITEKITVPANKAVAATPITKQDKLGKSKLPKGQPTVQDAQQQQQESARQLQILQEEFNKLRTAKLKRKREEKRQKEADQALRADAENRRQIAELENQIETFQQDDDQPQPKRRKVTQQQPALNINRAQEVNDSDNSSLIDDENTDSDTVDAMSDDERQNQQFSAPVETCTVKHHRQQARTPQQHDSSEDEDYPGSVSARSSSQVKKHGWACTGSACTKTFPTRESWVLHFQNCPYNFGTPGDRDWGDVGDFADMHVTTFNRTVHGDDKKDDNVAALNPARFYPISGDWNMAHAVIPYEAEPVRVNYPLEQLGIIVANKRLLANMHKMTFTNMSLLHFTDENLARPNVKFTAKKSGMEDDEIATKESRVPVLLKALNNYRVICRMIFPARYEADIFYTAMISKFLDPLHPNLDPGALIKHFKDHLQLQAINVKAKKPPPSYKEVGSEVTDNVIRTLAYRVAQVENRKGNTGSGQNRPRTTPFQGNYRGRKSGQYTPSTKYKPNFKATPQPATDGQGKLHCYKFNSSKGCNEAETGNHITCHHTHLDVFTLSGDRCGNNTYFHLCNGRLPNSKLFCDGKHAKHECRRTKRRK